MKVRMITLAAGPEGVLQPGQEVELPAKEAMALIAGGYAEEVESQPAEETLESVRETAAVEPPEQAVTPKKTTKRRKKRS